MAKGDLRDIIGGGALIAIGAFSIWYSSTYLQIGELSRMGTGMFPIGIGIILAGLGAMIFFPAFARESSRVPVDFRSFAAIMASILAFALLLRPFGLVPAIFGLTLTASWADRKLTLHKLLLLAAALSAGATAIFKIGLGLPVPIASWPW